jgi:hypothetical protein
MLRNFEFDSRYRTRREKEEEKQKKRMKKEDGMDWNASALRFLYAIPKGAKKQRAYLGLDQSGKDFLWNSVHAALVSGGEQPKRVRVFGIPGSERTSPKTKRRKEWSGLGSGVQGLKSIRVKTSLWTALVRTCGMKSFGGRDPSFHGSREIVLGAEYASLVSSQWEGREDAKRRGRIWDGVWLEGSLVPERRSRLPGGKGHPHAAGLGSLVAVLDQGRRRRALVRMRREEQRKPEGVTSREKGEEVKG